jgi:hypothetical protein
MAQVHTFSLITQLYEDTRLPLQFLGGGNTPAARQVELSTLLAWIESNITVPSAFAVKLISKIVIIGSASGTVSVGTSSGGTQILEAESYDTDGAVFAVDKYFHNSGTLYFSGFGAHTLTVKLIQIQL